MKILMDEYTIQRMPMISGQHEAVIRKYYKYIGKSGNSWFLSDQPNCADNILVTDNPENEKGEGFGGATLNLPLVDGGMFELHGGWHSNANSFFHDTGIDVQDRCYTRVIVAKDRKGCFPTVMKDVLYFEDGYCLGDFYRYKEIAQKLADELGETVFYYSESSGGSSSGSIQPTKKGENKND